MLRFVPEPVKRPIKDAWEAFKKKVPKILMFEESKISALKGFTNQFSIIAPKNPTLDPKTFLVAVKQKALEQFKPQTMVRVVLRVNMENYVPAAIEDNQMVELRNFQSKTEIILESTNLEVWIVMSEQVLENMATI